MSEQAQKPFVVPVFIPHFGCAHRCVFCNQETITGEKPVIAPAAELRTRIDRYLQYRGFRRTQGQIAFYGGNFLGLSPSQVRYFLQIVGPYVQTGKVDGIRFSTRPDTITEDRLDRIDGFPVRTVELGVQSMDDQVLRRIRRGHAAKDTELAVARLKARGYEVGLQVMVGLPGEDEASCLHTGGAVANLLPDFVRIYPTVVLTGSRLADWYERGAYTPLTLQAAVERCKRLVSVFQEKEIPIVRLGLQHTESLAGSTHILAGPYHPAFGELVYSALFFDRAMDLIHAAAPRPGKIVLKVHPRNVSKMRGFRNANIEQLSRKFGAVDIVAEPSVSEQSLQMGD